MTGVMLLNGQPPKQVEMPKDCFVICCDGAYNWAKEQKIAIDLLVGDFDSLGYVPDDCKTIKYPVEKNETDGEIALTLFKDKGCNKVFVYGAFGKRTDHFLGNLALLGMGKEKGIDVVLMGDEEKISLGSGFVKFIPQKKGTISLVPYGDSVHIINSKGLEYPLDDLVLKRCDTRGISNLSFADEVEFFVKEGQVLILESWRAE